MKGGSGGCREGSVGGTIVVVPVVGFISVVGVGGCEFAIPIRTPGGRIIYEWWIVSEEEFCVGVSLSPSHLSVSDEGNLINTEECVVGKCLPKVSFLEDRFDPDVTTVAVNINVVESTRGKSLILRCGVVMIIFGSSESIGEEIFVVSYE